MKYLFIIRTNQIIRRFQENTSLFMSDLNDQTWYQICIANIYSDWKTGLFSCKQLLYDYPVTGPVTNVLVASEIDKIFISWSYPKYMHDNPQGYYVHLKGPHNFCSTVNIKMVIIKINIYFC